MNSPVSLLPSLSNLNQLSITELADAQCAINTIWQVAVGMTCQPRFHRGIEYNPAGQVVHELEELIGQLAFDLAAAVEARQPNGKDEAQARAYCRLVHGSQTKDTFNELCVIAAEAAAA